MPPKIKNECDFCKFETELKSYKRDNKKGEMRLCDICASTYAGNAHEYPQYHEGELHIMAQVSYIGNLISEKIKNRNISIEVARSEFVYLMMNLGMKNEEQHRKEFRQLILDLMDATEQSDLEPLYCEIFKLIESKEKA